MGVQDETISALNARLPELVDHTLGFGVLEGTVKQQLQALPRSPPFSPYSHAFNEFQSAENTSTLDGAMAWEQIIRRVPIAMDVGLQHNARVERQTVREESIVVFHFKRIIAMRSIPTPAFKKLLPVKKNRHLDGKRWLVELYGNQICTTEYYGGEATIAFRWKHDANVSTAQVITAIAVFA